MATAARWCPDATESVREAAARRLTHETAAMHGLSRFLGWAPVVSPPGFQERELSDAVEQAMHLELARSPIQILDRLRNDAASQGLLDPVHPLGFGMAAISESCRTCAWYSLGRCLQTFRPGKPGRKTDPTWPACVRWEPVLTDDSCGACGACCREGYSLAPVKRGEAMRKAHPEWIRESPLGAHLPRPDGRCVALAGNGSPDAPWRCRDYPVRMRACAELATGSKACLIARRRVGSSR